jgi:hypothetical protein
MKRFGFNLVLNLYENLIKKLLGFCDIITFQFKTQIRSGEVDEVCHASFQSFSNYPSTFVCVAALCSFSCV